MKFLKAVMRIVVGVVFGLVAALALSPAAATFAANEGSNAPLLMPLVVLISAALAFFAPTIRRAFGRGFLLAGVSLLALPLSMMLLSGRAASEVIAASEGANQGAAAVGAGIAGVAMTGLATFVGLILGGIFVLIGLVLALGGRRQVEIVSPMPK